MHSWSLSILLVLCSMVLLYVWNWRRLHRALPNALEIWRPVAFFAGTLVLGAALASPLALLDHHYLTAHMAQHLLIMTVAAPLILLAAPVVTLMHALPPRIFGLFHRRITIAHPVFCWLAGVAVVIVWHVPKIFALGMKSQGWHSLEQATFIAAGFLFWWPVIRPWPAVAKWPPWSIPVYLFLAALPCDALSSFLCLCNKVVYPYYSLKDQACAGALMWVWVTFVYLFPAAALTFRLLSPERRFLEEQVV
jgi:putative membrane protein